MAEKNAAPSSANRRGANGNENELIAMAAEEIKTIQVIGFPMDLGADRRGVDQRPSAIRIAGLLETVAALGCRVEDAGDIAVRVEERPTTTYICSTATTRTSGSLLRWT